MNSVMDNAKWEFDFGKMEMVVETTKPKFTRKIVMMLFSFSM